MALLAAGSLALTFAPARAGVTGTIVMATAGSPAAARIAFVVNNNRNVEPQPGTFVLGYVGPVPIGARFFRVRPASPDSTSDFDIFFYNGPRDGAPGEAVPKGAEDKWAHSGSACDEIPADGSWAVVTLSVGAADQFQLDFGTSPLAC